jgi:flagellar biosynthesis component FlhA
LSEAGYDREVRTGLRNVIASRHARQGWLEVHVVDEGWRIALNSPLSTADLLKLQRAVAAAVGDGSDAVLLTDAQTRRVLSDLLYGDRPGLTVLAFTDLPPHLNIRQLAPVV